MKLVFIYGPPGVGKLTTAKALAELTGFRLFHNHLSFDLVKAVFDLPTPPFHRLSETIRLATFEAAAREKMRGLLFTFVYAAGEDDAFVGRVVQVMETHGGQVLFVRLHCDRTTHEGRVTSKERKRLGKIADAENLRGALKRWNLEATIPFGETLQIDNSNDEPAAAARQIAERFALIER